MLEDDPITCRICHAIAVRTIERTYWPWRGPCVEHDDCRQLAALGDECAKRTYAPRHFRNWVCRDEQCVAEVERRCAEWYEAALREGATYLGKARDTWEWYRVD